MTALQEVPPFLLHESCDSVYLLVTIGYSASHDLQRHLSAPLLKLSGNMRQYGKNEGRVRTEGYLTELLKTRAKPQADQVMG